MTVYNSADPNQRSVAYRAGYSQDWLDANIATNGDYWSYVTRGVAWDYHLAAYYQYPYYGEYTPDAISTSTTSALGYKPNNPGTVPLNSTFLIGAVRHKNFPIYSQIHWVHSSFDIRIGDLEESFPFDQQETDNDTDTTAVRRKGGPYEWVSCASAPRTCPSSAPYYALARSDGNWHCFQKVGEGKGRYDIYTDQPQYYPGSAGKPDQTPDSDDALTITKTTSDQTITVNGIPYRLLLSGFVPNADGNCPATPPAGSTGRLTDTPNFAPGLTVRSAAFAIYDNEALSGDPVSVLDGGSSFVTAPLETGKTYWLVETRAPAGHALLPRPVAFHIETGTDADATTVVKTDFGADEGFSSVRVLPASGRLPGDRTPGIRVVDTQVGVLPKAGSIGIYPQLAGGAALLGLAGACAWRRRERTQDA